MIAHGKDIKVDVYKRQFQSWYCRIVKDIIGSIP